jgi:uncharacterized radical SAM protein YgiQ
LIEAVGDKRVVVNPPFKPMTEAEIDSVYALPFKYLPHPRYNKKEAIPAYEMIKFSVNIHRGCFGGCGFCAISAHQGKQIVNRSEKSIIKEVETLTDNPDFKGYISDLGGPSANMYGMGGKDLQKCQTCSRPSCIYPSVCNNLETNHKRVTELYREVDKIAGIKKSFIGSGVRYDLLFSEWNKNAGKDEENYLRELILNHVSGRLKVAPEHTSETVLAEMRKPPFNLFKKLKNKFDQIIKSHGLNFELIPYFISAHPACSDEDMKTLASEMKSLNLKPEQVQDFTPTPMTLATTMFYTGFNQNTNKKVFVARSIDEKRKQKNYFFWWNNANRTSKS